MSPPRALDLFCGAGGSADGLAAAGFDVVGVDHHQQRRHPFAFILGDALSPPVDFADFDLVWASPPCQRYSNATPAEKVDGHPDLIAPVRRMLAQRARGTPLLTIIENVNSAPVRGDVVLSGPMFGLDRVCRIRKFEINFLTPLVRPIKRLAPGTMASGRGIVVAGNLSSKSHGIPRRRAGLPWRVPVSEARAALGITRYMTGPEVVQAIPPAYAEFLGRAAMWAIPASRRSKLKPSGTNPQARAHTPRDTIPRTEHLLSSAPSPAPTSSIP